MIGSFDFRACVSGFVGLLVMAPAAEAQFCSNCEQAPIVQVGDTPFVGSATGCFIPAQQGGCLQPSSNTLFFAFTPSLSGAYRISTCTGAAAGFAVLSVWSDCSGSGFIGCCNLVCTLDPVCCAGAWDRSCVGAAAIFCFDTCATPPANDECSKPIPAIVGANTFRNVQTQGTTETPCGTIYSDVWFSYTATSDRPVTLSLCDADGGWALVSGGDQGELDTRIAVFDFCGGSLVACNDNACGVRSKLQFTPACGATYLIAIGSAKVAEGIYDQGIGSFTLLQSGSCDGDCPADIDGDGEVSSSDLGALLSAWGPCP